MIPIILIVLNRKRSIQSHSFVKIDDYNMADLSVKINDLQLKNPVMTASGTFGYGLEFADFVPLEEIGGYYRQRYDTGTT